MSRITTLDGVRGLAAVAVFLWHALDVYYPAVIDYAVHSSAVTAGVDGWLGGVLRALPVGIVANGEFAVVVFFVLSGYVMTVLGSSARDPDKFAVVIGQRVLRLFPVVCLGAAVGYLGWVSGWADLSQLTAVNGVTKTGIDDTAERGLPAFLNQVFVTVWRTETPHGLYNRSLWTIGVELRASMVLLLLGRVFAGATRPAAYLCGLVIGCLVVGPYYVAFAAGAVLAEAYPPGGLRPVWPASRQVVAVLGAALAGAIHSGYNGRLWLWVGPPVELPGRFTVGLLVHTLGAVCLIAVVLNARWPAAVLDSTAVQFLGRASFPFYALHQPLLYAAGGMTALTGLPYGWMAVLGTAGVAVVGLPLAVAVTRFLDLPCNAWTKRFVRTHLFDPPPSRHDPDPRTAVRQAVPEPR
jgi:peptidoglycan/LPS O-acetylase OafA/YrhL